MTQQQTKTLKMMYSGNLEYISCPIKAKYEECIEIACERFEIPAEFKNYIQISNGSRYVFGKYTFEYFNMLFPSPEIIFYIKLDYNGLLGTLESETESERTPFTKLNNKRRNSDEHEGVPVTRQNCFIGSIAGIEIESPDTEEPHPKRQKIIITRSRKSLKKISSRKSIRI